MNMKLVALDLDGTTLDPNQEITPETKNILEKLYNLGIYPVIATGRVKSALPENILSIKGIKYAITSNGAMITELETNSILYQNCINANMIPKIIDEIKSEDIILEIFAKGQAFIDEIAYNKIDSSGLPDWHINYIKRTRKPVSNVFDFMMENKDYIENININIVDDERRAIFRKKMEKIDNVTITSSSMRNVEIGGNTTSKADGLRVLCKKLNISPEETVAIGDSQNDIPMLKFAGISVAMGNSAQNVKDLSDIVTDTNGNNGVSKALEELLKKQGI